MLRLLSSLVVGVSNYTVAVANATPEVLEAADEVTAANTDDGVALLLERILAVGGQGG